MDDELSINLASLAILAKVLTTLLQLGFSMRHLFHLSIFIAILILYFCFKSGIFKSHDNLLAGGVLAAVIAWYLTAGELGLNFMEEAEFLEGDQNPMPAVFKLTFVQPSAVFIRLLKLDLIVYLLIFR